MKTAKTFLELELSDSLMCDSHSSMCAFGNPVLCGLHLCPQNIVNLVERDRILEVAFRRPQEHPTQN